MRTTDTHLTPGGSGGIANGAIDLHYHFIPDHLRAALERNGMIGKEGWGLPDWDIDSGLAFMDELGIATAIMAVSQPGVYFGDIAEAIDLARSTNDEGASIVQAHPSRFGLLASLPLPDVDAACAEATRAFDELGADGIALMTHYGGKYLGDPAYEPLMAELDRRSALIALHPMIPVGWEEFSFGIPAPVIEFPMDTTRTVVNLILSGTLERYPRLRIIVPHVGSAIPALADRVQKTAAMLAGDGPVQDVIGQLRRLYYDVAGAPLPRALPALLNLVGPEQIVYGSDIPFTPAPGVVAGGQELENTVLIDNETREALRRGNALRLIPRLADASELTRN